MTALFIWAALLLAAIPTARLLAKKGINQGNVTIW